MQMQNKIKGLLILISFVSAVSTEAQVIDCDRRPAIPAENQRIRELTYENIEALKESSVGKDVKKLEGFRKEYVNLRVDFNKVFTSMKTDREHFAGYKKLCNRYSGDLQSLIKRAQDYNAKVETALGEQVASLGVDDVTNILDWLLKKREAGSERFYTALAWKPWAEIGKVEKGATKENDASKDTKETKETKDSKDKKDKKASARSTQTKRS